MKTWIIHFVLGGILSVATALAGNHPSPSEDKADIIASEHIANDSEYKLVFFGYAGCYHFCDPRLKQIDPIYERIKKELDVKMLFIDISEETTLASAQAFVKDVNKEFEAIDPDHETIQTLQKMFQDVYIRKMPDGEYWHSGFLYLLKRYGGNYELLKIYLEFTQTDAVVADIKKATAE